MSFHVEISSSLNHARAFNLSAEELQRGIVEPWLIGRTIELGDHEWEPHKSSLKILEGPHLDTAELSFGRGWSNAERSAGDVTRRELARAPQPSVPDTFVIESDLPEATVAALLTAQEAHPVAWPEVEARLNGRDPRIAAVIVVVKRPESDPPRS
jgi:hypothetical protein